MEFIKVGKNYMIKGSNGRIVSEKEKLQLENNELILKDIEGCDCQKETTKKISKNKKRLKELDMTKRYTIKINKDTEEIEEIKETAPVKEDDADDTIKKTNSII